MLQPSFLSDLSDIVGDDRLVLDTGQLKTASRDCFHFSPILIPQLSDKAADVIARPESQAQLMQLIGAAVKHRVPIIPRGAGTGNYGQGVPLHGGLMINTKDLNRIVHIDEDSARVEAGVVLQDIEKQAATLGAELRMFPSTMPTSSTGGFITGGSGGVGSIEWGMLREADNVRHARILTIEEQPRVMDLPRSELEGVLHNCGLTCFVAEVTLALAPKTAWRQYVIAFDDFFAALQAAQSVAQDISVRKRLVSVFEWPVPSFFVPLVKKGACPEGASALFLYTDLAEEPVRAMMAPFGGEITFHEPPGNGVKRGTQIYDYTWNHTTQWAMKADSNYTYLQDRFELENLAEQIKARKAMFPEVLGHVEFIHADGEIVPGGLTVVDYQGEQRLRDLIEYCEAHNIRVSNPHTYFLDDDTRWYGDAFLRCKAEWDPLGLLNPGHLHNHAAAVE
ncbi:MAG: FAD-binding oxidoreductase [Pseudomonadota bacterium]